MLVFAQPPTLTVSVSLSQVHSRTLTNAPCVLRRPCVQYACCNLHVRAVHSSRALGSRSAHSVRRQPGPVRQQSSTENRVDSLRVLWTTARTAGSRLSLSRSSPVIYRWETPLPSSLSSRQLYLLPESTTIEQRASSNPRGSPRRLHPLSSYPFASSESNPINRSVPI